MLNESRLYGYRQRCIFNMRRKARFVGKRSGIYRIYIREGKGGQGERRQVVFRHFPGENEVSRFRPKPVSMATITPKRKPQVMRRLEVLVRVSFKFYIAPYIMVTSSATQTFVIESVIRRGTQFSTCKHFLYNVSHFLSNAIKGMLNYFYRFISALYVYILIIDYEGSHFCIILK